MVKLRTLTNNSPTLPKIKSFTRIFQGIYPRFLVVI